MWFNTLLYLSVSISCAATNNLDVSDLSKSVLDFIKHKNKPTAVNLLLECWTKHDLKTFSNQFSKQDVTLKTIRSSSLATGAKTDQDMINHKMFISDFDCYQASNKTIFEEIDEHWWQFPYRWFIFINEISSLTKKLPLWVNSRVYLFQKTPPHILTSPYVINIKNETIYNYNSIAKWSTDVRSSNGYEEMSGGYADGIKDISDYEDRSNQKRLLLNSTAVVVFNRTLDHLFDYRYLNEDSITKHNYHMLLYIIDVLNATVAIKWVHAWGTLNPNTSKYNQMMGDLQTNAADIGGTSGFIVADRLKFLYYVGNPLPTSTRFIFRAPPLSAVSNLLTLPFEMDVWVAMALWTLLIFVLMLITVKWEWSQLETNEFSNNALRPNSVDVLQLQIGVICQQGIEAEPRSLSGKIITFTSLITCVFLYTSYSGAIVALLQSTSSESITTLEDLLTTNIQLGVDNMPYSVIYFMKQKGEVEEAISRAVLPANKPRQVFSAAVGVEKLRTEFFAFHCERDTVYKHISKTFQEHEKCGLVEIKYLPLFDPFFAIRKKLPYKDIITMAFSRFKEHGISRRIFNIVYSEKPKCTGAGNSFRSVSINDIYFAVMVYTIGVSVSLLVYFLEWIIFNKRKHI